MRARVLALPSQEWIQERRQKVKCKVKSLLKRTTQAERRRAKSERDASWGSLTPFKRAFLRVFVFLLANHLALSPPGYFVLGGVHVTLSQDESRREGFWEEQDSLWPGIAHFLHKCSVALVSKRGSRDALIFYSSRVLPLFVPALIVTLSIAMTVTLRCLQERKPGCLPCFSCCFRVGRQIRG